MPKKQARAKARELLETVGLPDKAESYPVQLSGGQKQRIAIARALASDPEVLLCDEATSALDPKTTGQILSLLQKINRERGITVVLITHHMNEAMEADRAIVMNRGQVAMDGTPRAVFARVEELRALGLAAPDTVELLYELRSRGIDIPLDAMTVEECADAICHAFSGEK